MSSIHRKLFLALKKVRIVEITPSQVPFTWKKIPPSSKIYDPPPLPPTHPLLLFGKPCKQAIACTHLHTHLKVFTQPFLLI